MLEVKNISSGYGKKQVLFDVSFEIRENQIVILTGGNGSGKSTVLKCIFNLLPLWDGGISFNKQRIDVLKSSDLLGKGMVYIPQKNKYFENLSVNENLKVSGNIYSNEALNEKVLLVYEEFPLLKDFSKKTPFSMSGGERQILAFGMALVHTPSLILFDEPLAGLDSKYASIIGDKIQDMNNDKSISFLIVEHRKSLIKIADEEYKIELGKLT